MAEMEEKPPYLSVKGAKYALGTHRGPLPSGQGDGGEVEQVETALSLEKRQRTRTEAMRRHWARFWCCYIFFSIIFLAIILPVFFLVILPAVSQRVVDNSDLVLVEASVMEPRPDSVILTMKSALKLPIGVPVRIDPITLDLFNPDHPGNTTWAKIYINGTVIQGNTTLGVTNQFTPLNADEWAHYVDNVVNMEHAPLCLRGSTMSYLGQLKSPVTMDKTIKQNTLNGFAGFAIEGSQLLLPPESDGTNLIANATLPNPSVMTLEIGTTVLDLKSGDIVIGTATIDNLVLRPGNHSNPVRGKLDLGAVLKNLGPVLQSQKDSLRNGYLSLDTVGKSVVYDGVEVPYYTNVMKNLTLTAKIPIGGLLVNTLRGLFNKNGTNILQGLNIGESSSSGSNGGLLQELGNLNLSSLVGDLGVKLGRRSLAEFLEQPEERSILVDVLKGLL
ncbi:DUF3712 domain-containing protein [Aspergillus clavatus NRRL 1]|uniref:Uncharacterized protein n=1 Tax=Aspergillus clavatus (strain ATCC 1007 / CBS 513.65 / DSM 816 / NCTC 3887 / NRRL 1 / QM 1276 / 107) TaxID=344612 RepID=A1CL78_ASPCL|nr:uncharacterized protein ACLA_041180 [Aspergillus clavatus NRRL 1]EAW09902.1 conserved hypothetical protein [Aspergillus clavatus NRRL 1]